MKDTWAGLRVWSGLQVSVVEITVSESSNKDAQSPVLIIYG